MHEQTMGPIQSAVIQSETLQKLIERSIATLKVSCFKCKATYDFPGIFNLDKITSGLICIKCKFKLPEAYVRNRVTLFLKQMLVLYYEGKKILFKSF